jgi:hypothetical protein
MESKADFIKNVLYGMYEEIDELKKNATKDGFVPEEICNLCDQKQTNLIHFTEKEKNIIKKFIEWIKKYEVIEINKEHMNRKIIFKSDNKVIKGSRLNLDENAFVYRWDTKDTKSRLSKELNKIKGVKTFLRKFDEISICDHYDFQDLYFVHYIEEKEFIGINNIFKRNKNILLIGCLDCILLKQNAKCNKVYKEGFLYKFRCNFTDIVLKKRLNDHMLQYETVEIRKKWIGTYDTTWETMGIYSHPSYYLRDRDIFIQPSAISQEDETLKHLKPNLLVLFMDQSKLPRLLELNINILFYNESGFFYYNKNRQVQNDFEIICNEIVQNLNNEIENQRGNDHDRVISALNTIGNKLGFVIETEFSQSGVRIDLVWYNREGNIEIAGEVETSSTWKKDLISTWEVEPKLAIIVGFPKTDKVVENLMKLTLMKYVPHPVLYINKGTEKAFLIEQQEIIKYYELNQDLSVQKEEIQIL